MWKKSQTKNYLLTRRRLERHSGSLCLEIRSRNEEAINSTRNRIYLLIFFTLYFIDVDSFYLFLNWFSTRVSDDRKFKDLDSREIRSLQNMRGFDHVTILSSSFHGVRKERLAQWPAFCDPNTTKKSGGGLLPEKLGGVCSHLLETLTLFQTKICDFPYPISDLIKNLIPYFRPEALEPGAWPERVTSCYGTYTVVGVNIKREMVLSPNDEEVANSSKKHTQFKTRVHKPYPISDPNGRNWYPISDQNGWKTIPVGAAHTHIAYMRDYPPGRKTRCRLWVSLLTQARLMIITEWSWVYRKWRIKVELTILNLISVTCCLLSVIF